MDNIYRVCRRERTNMTANNAETRTVTEQNPQAVGFYEHLGFSTYRRTELDEEGRPYPLLYMRLLIGDSPQLTWPRNASSAARPEDRRSATCCM